MKINGIKKIEFVSAGFDTILSCAGVTGLVQQHTGRITSTANAKNTRGGSGFVSNVKVATIFGHPRIRGYITSTDKASAMAESEDKVLSGAV